LVSRIIELIKAVRKFDAKELIFLEDQFKIAHIIPSWKLQKNY